MTQLPYDHGGDASEPLREVMARIRSMSSSTLHS
jgi:hypothetical protein